MEIPDGRKVEETHDRSCAAFGRKAADGAHRAFALTLALSRRARGIGGAGVDGAIADMDPVEGLT